MTHPTLELELLARLQVQIAEPYDGGVTATGEASSIIPIIGGTVEGPLAEIARFAYDYSQKLRESLAIANLANSAESIIGMLPV